MTLTIDQAFLLFDVITKFSILTHAQLSSLNAKDTISISTHYGLKSRSDPFVKSPRLGNLIDIVERNILTVDCV